MPYFTHGDASIFYTVEKPSTEQETTTKKSPVVLIHGWTCDSHDWSFQIPTLLSLGLTLIIPDLRGHGHSNAPESTYTLSEIATDLSALVRHLEAGPAILIGHSLGAVLASHVAVLDPEIVKAVVLVDPVYGTAPTPPDAIEVVASDPAAPAAIAAFWDTVMYTESSPPWLRTWHRRRTQGAPLQMVQRFYREAMTPSEANWGHPASCEEFLKRIGVPRLVTYSAFMGGKGVELERRVGIDEGKGDQVLLLSGLGHWLHKEDPDKFNAILENWLRVNCYV